MHVSQGSAGTQRSGRTLLDELSPKRSQPLQPILTGRQRLCGPEGSQLVDVNQVAVFSA